MFYCIPYISFILVLTSYMLGSIPFGLLITKAMGYGDVRKQGSGNIGATNVVRAAGKTGGVLTLLLDGGKGALAIILVQQICPDYLLMIFCGLAAFVGHIFPIWLNFKGGKGVATGFAVMLMLNIILGVSTLALWILAFLIFRISALSALISYSLAPFVAYVVTLDPRLTIAISMMSILVIIRHISNIKAMISGKK